MQGASRLAFYWAAVAWVWRWPVRCVSKGCPRHKTERSSSSKVSKTKLPLLMLRLIRNHLWMLSFYCSISVISAAFFLVTAVIVFACSMFFASACCRLAEDEMGSDRHEVPDQTIQRLAASHSHCQHRHCLHRGRQFNAFLISAFNLDSISLSLVNLYIQLFIFCNSHTIIWLWY